MPRIDRTIVMSAGVALAVLPASALAQRPAPLVYPKTATVSQVDDYHGTRVADPFRWLEDDTASAVKTWVNAQNTVTFGYLKSIPFRDSILSRLKTLSNYSRQSAPIRHAGWVLTTRNNGLQNQSVYYLQRGITGTASILMDPNTLSKDGTTRVDGFTFNKAGTRLAYTRSEAGSDWQEIRVMNPATRRETGDRVRWVKASGIAWAGNGFYYTRFPAPSDTLKALSSKNENSGVYFHTLGTPQSADRLVFEDPSNPLRLHQASTTHDERFLVLASSDSRSGTYGNSLFIRDLTRADTSWEKVTLDFAHTFEVLEHEGRALLVRTNRNAPNGRVVRIDLDSPDEARWTTIIPEQPQALEAVTAVGGRLIASYLKDVTTRLVQYRYDGTMEREIALPALGTAEVLAADRTADDAYYQFASFTEPPSTYRLDLATGKSTLHHRSTVPFDASQFETRQVFVTSKDGTKVPMFIVAKKGLVLDGKNPTWMYGYGGFNLTTPPAFSPSRIAWLEQGGIYAHVNLRGGGEYGESWHQAGTKERKQNVFDDFIASAEWLIANDYTSKDKLAMQGGSNGGLLVGAVMTQRPDLFKVALPAVGVMDMLRFQKFTIGWYWVADYGSSDTPEGFAYLSKYSPLHTLKDGVSYPATLVTTADHDDRVVPAHSFKFAARLQQAHHGDNPVLIRVETASGHGSSSLTKALEVTADLYAFTMFNLGMQPRVAPAKLVP